jgi:hypothetical protein
MQEVDDQVCRRPRLFLRDPVPAIRVDHIFNVIGDPFPAAISAYLNSASSIG